MTGSIQVKNGKYYAVINTYINGKRKPKWIPTGLDKKGNKRKAEQILIDKIKEYELKENLINTEILFGDYLVAWLKSKKISIDEITYKSYQWICESHLLPYFREHKIQLCKLTRNDIQDFINYKAEYGRLDHKGGLSAKTIKEQKNIINLACKDAVINNLLIKNPCEYVKLPQAQKREPTFYTKELANELLRVTRNDDLYPLIYVTMCCGLRRSEVLGLQWDSIDYDENRIIIKHTRVNYRGAVVEKDKTKNKSSYRTYPLTDNIKQLLMNLKKRENENRLIFGESYIDNDYIFKWDNGKPYSPDYVTDKFTKLLVKNNLPHIRFHDLRHTCASLLLNDGKQLKDVSDWLGHSSIETTANIYGHLDKNRKQDISNSINAILEYC